MDSPSPATGGLTLTPALPIGNTNKRASRWLVRLGQRVIDQAFVLLALVVAYWMRYLTVWPEPFNSVIREVATQNFVEPAAFLWVGLLLMVILAVLFEANSLYRLHHTSRVWEYASIILNSTITGIAVLIVFVFLYRPFFYSRLIFAFAAVNITVLLIGWRWLLSLTRRMMWVSGVGRERVLVVGATGLGLQVMDGILTNPRLGYDLIGYLEDAPTERPRQSRYKHAGTFGELEKVVQEKRINVVILALPYWETGRLPALVDACRNTGVEFRVAPDLYALNFDRVDVMNTIGVPLIDLKEVSLQGFNLVLKRILDLMLIVLASPVILPVCGLIALMIKLDSPGPALFKQTRVGKNGKHFKCFKFRTMVVDAEKLRAELEKHNEANGPLFKMKRDPRITKVGAWLRKSSLDELPQLWNVIRGEMSLVGPRPALPVEVDKYAHWHLRRMEVMPGMTGLWQVMGRSDTSFEEMVRLDIYYAENWTPMMDLRIIFMTVPTVVLAKGAY